MTDTHAHVFLGEGHEHAERRTWAVIWLCGAMMVLEIAGGTLFGSLALVADGLHMSTHAGALLLAALAYSYARRHAGDAKFSFGTGKLGDLAGFTSAIVLAMISVLIGYEAVARFVAPVPIHFAEAIPIAVLGLAVNVASAWLLSAGGHHHHHGPGQDHAHGHAHGHAPGLAHGHNHRHDEAHRIASSGGDLLLSVCEDDQLAVFRIVAEAGATLPQECLVETVRPDGARQIFAMDRHGDCLQSRGKVAEPHAFTAMLAMDGQIHAVSFEEHGHGGHAHQPGAAHRDNNMRAAVVHVIADAAVSVLVIIGLILARAFGWLWMDPLAGIIGAGVIASWSVGLIRDTGAILLDMTPDQRTEGQIRDIVQAAGDRVLDLHVWRLGPGHLGVIVSVEAPAGRGTEFHRRRLERLPSVSHLTVEVREASPA